MQNQINKFSQSALTKEATDQGWDVIHSKLYWKITLHKDFQFRREVIDGYSKKIGHAEAHDPIYLLKRKCINPLYQYLSKSTEISVCARVSDFINRDIDKIILILKPTGYECSDKLLMNADFIHFMNNYYKRYQKGLPVADLLPRSATVKSKDDYTNVKMQNDRIGTNEVKLNNYISWLAGQGFPPGQYLNFYNQYKQQYLL